MDATQLTFTHYNAPSGNKTEAVEDPCHCGRPSDIGVHGVDNGIITDAYYCLRHWHEERRNQ